MADLTYTVERFENGVLVSTRTVTKPADQVNLETITEQAVTALNDNTTYIALSNPSNAQVAAQVKALTRQNNKIIRLILGRLDSTE
jgi:hypothetical protein